MAQSYSEWKKEIIGQDAGNVAPASANVDAAPAQESYAEFKARNKAAFDTPTPASNQGAFVSTLKSTGAHLLNSALGQPLEDIGAGINSPGLQQFGKGVRQYAEGVQKDNPSQINSLSDVVEQPVNAVKTALGNVVPQVPVSLASAYAGAQLGALTSPVTGPVGPVVGGLAGLFAPSYLQEYTEMRGKQHETGQEDIPKALGYAVPAAASEVVLDKVLLGGSKFLPSPLRNAAADTLAEGASRTAHIAKQGLKGFGAEAGQEYGQTYLEQLGGNQDTSTQQAAEERNVGAALGGIGGGIIKGGAAAFDPRAAVPDTVDINEQSAQRRVSPITGEPVPEITPDSGGLVRALDAGAVPAPAASPAQEQTTAGASGIIDNAEQLANKLYNNEAVVNDERSRANAPANELPSGDEQGISAPQKVGSVAQAEDIYHPGTSGVAGREGEITGRSVVENTGSGINALADAGAFVPTHELNDGTPVVKAGANTFVDVNNDEWQADDATPITQPAGVVADTRRAAGAVDYGNTPGTPDNAQNVTQPDHSNPVPDTTALNHDHSEATNQEAATAQPAALNTHQDSAGAVNAAARQAAGQPVQKTNPAEIIDQATGLPFATKSAAVKALSSKTAYPEATPASHAIQGSKEAGFVLAPKSFDSAQGKSSEADVIKAQETYVQKNTKAEEKNPVETAGTQAAPSTSLRTGLAVIGSTWNGAHGSRKIEKIEEGRAFISTNGNTRTLDVAPVNEVQQLRLEDEARHRAGSLTAQPYLIGKNDKPFSTEKMAQLQIKRLKHNPDDFEIKPVDGGFVAVRKTSGDQAIKQPSNTQATESKVSTDNSGYSLNKEQNLIDHGLLKQHHQYSDRWLYKFSPESAWMTATNKEDAIEQAQKAFEEIPEKERLTTKKKDAIEQADKDAATEKLYGKKSIPDLENEVSRLEKEIVKHRKAGEREFNDNGGRRTSAAVSNEAARSLAEEKRRLQYYIEKRIAATPSTQEQDVSIKGENVDTSSNGASDISSSEIGADISDRKACKLKVLEKLRPYYQDHPSEVRSHDGDKIVVAWNGIKHAMNAGLPTWQEAAAALHIEKLIANSSVVDVKPDKHGRNDPKSTTTYQTKAKFDGVLHKVSIFVRNHSDGNRYYDHVTIESKGPAGLTGSIEPTLPFTGPKKGELAASDESIPQASKSATKAAYNQFDDLGEKIGGARKDTAISTGKSTSRKSTDERPAWMRRFVVQQIVAGNNEGKWLITDTRSKDWTGQPKRVGDLQATEAEAQAVIPLIAVSLKHRVISGSKRADGEYNFEIWRTISDRKRVKVVNKEFADRAEAMAYMAKHAQAIIETNTTFGEADLPTPENTNRVGVERRTGDVEGNNFMDAFGLRGVEFGNWNNQIERQQVVNAAYDGLVDLAEVLNIPTQAIGLNGDLALAFGARGHGLNSAKAHYERDKAAINLTKMSGSGALAHEWLHSLDHYLGRQDTKASSEWVTGKDGTRSLKTQSPEADMVSSGFKYANSGVREALRDAYNQVMDTIFYKAENYVEDTEKADKFVGRAKEDLATRLDSLRKELSAQKDPQYYKRNNKPASAEQLIDFDSIAQQLLNGEYLETQWKLTEGGKARNRFALPPGRDSNEVLDKISAIYKAVRGRNGFDSTNKNGVMDNLRDAMRRYDQRLKMLATAQQGDEKTRKVPTEFAMNAKELDQGRGENYWTTHHEMVARAFQGYVEDKIAEKGGKSPFLNYAPENAGIETPWGVKRPYPHGDERKAINQAFDKFVSVLETKVTSQGTALFARRSSVASNAVSFDTINSVINRVVAASPSHFSRDTVVVANAFGDLPLAIRDVAAQQGYDNNDPNERINGVTYQGKVYIVQGNIQSETEVEETLLHERIHQILHGNKADPQGLKLKAALNMLYLKLGGIGGINTLADQLGVNLKAARKQALTMPPGAARNAFIVDEFLAEAEGRRAYEHLPEKVIRALREFYGKLREWLRANGFTGLADAMGMQLDDFIPADLAYLLRNIRTQEAGSGDKAVRFHKAWHGSPHDHDKFDYGKIGSGEGTQVFGYGLYFTDKREIAEHYKNTLSSQLNLVGVSGKKYGVSQVEADEDAGRLMRIRDDNLRMFEEYLDDARSYLGKIANDIKKGVIKKTQGKLYNVELAPEADEYLDWNKPISEQSNKIKSILYKNNVIKDIDGRDGEVLTVLSTDRYMDDPKGGAFYEALGGFRGDSIRNDGVSGRTGQKNKEASDYLHSLGIRGIRYKADGSQSSANNYVIFDDKDIVIDAKYSKLQQSVDTPHTQTSLITAMREVMDKAYGKGWFERLQATGKFKVIGKDEAQAISGVKAVDAQGFYDPKTDTTYFVAENIGETDDLKGLMLHEIGVHALQLGKNDAEFQNILTHLENLNKLGNAKVKEAFDRVPKDTKPEHVTEEVAAYLVSNYPDLPVSRKIIAWFRNAIRNIVKALPPLERLQFYRWAANLNEEDIVFMANAALRSAPDSLLFDNVGRNGEGVRVSQSAMKSVDANIKRGREAMTKALLDKTTVHRAMFRTGMGWVDFVWGSEGLKPLKSGKRPGAKGIAHILEARQSKDGLSGQEAESMLFDLVDTIAKGNEIQRNEVGKSTRVGLRNEGNLVWLTKHEGSNAWIVTGYRENPDGRMAGRATHAPTQSDTSLTRDGLGAGETKIPQADENSSVSIRSPAHTGGETPPTKAAGGNPSVNGEVTGNDSTAHAALSISTNHPEGGGFRPAGYFDESSSDIKFSFAGKHSATADTFQLDNAQQRLESGEDAETVRQDTGWHIGADGKARYEISDHDALYLPYFENSIGKAWTKPLDEVIEHPKLFAAYPQLKNLQVESSLTMKEDTAQYDPDNNTITFAAGMDFDTQLNVLLHEIQHGIQNEEGFASGGTASGLGYSDFTEDYKARLDALRDQAEAARKAGDEAKAKTLETQRAQLYYPAQYEAYLRLAGEVEARNTQARMEMTDKERKTTAPKATADTQDSDVVVVFNGKAMDAAPPPVNGSAGGFNNWFGSLFNKTNFDTAIYNLQDRYIDLKRQMEKVIKQGGTIQELEDPRLGEELFHQRTASRIKSFYGDEFSPILQAMHKMGISKAQFETFLQARHAPSRNKVMAERNPNQAMIDKAWQDAKADLARTLSGTANQRAIDAARKEVSKWERAKAFKGTEAERLSLSGMSDKQASDTMASLTPMQRVNLEVLGKRIDKINNATLDLMVAYGMETPQSIQALKDQWDFYVPLHRDEAHPDDNNFGHPIGSGFSVKGSGLRNATGSNAEVTNILAHIAAAREQMLKRGEKNLVQMRLAGFIANHPDADFAEVGKVPTLDYLVNGLVETLPDPLFKNRDNVVMMRVKGKDVAIVFNDKHPENIRLALSLKNMDGVNLDKVESIIAKGTRWLASVNTQYNVVFGVMNLLRDTQGAMLGLTSTPLHGKQRQVFGNMGKALKVIASVERGWAGADPALKAMYERFNKAGGTTGYSQMFEGVTDRDQSIQKELDALSAGKTKQSWEWIKKSLTDFNTVMENSARLATFMAGVEAGLSDDQAASIAKNITVNFNRKGAYTTKLGAFYAFFNASMQGTARLAETLTGPKGKQIIAGGVALGAMTTLLGMAALGDDEWDKIPEFVRERSLILPAPWNDSGYIAIPMPLGFHLLPNIGRKFVESAFGSKRVSPQQRLLQLAGSAVGAFNPLGGADISSMVMPTVLDPALALWRNKDFTGRTIYQADFNSLNPTPGFTRTKDTATIAAKLVAEWANKLTGGTDAKQGLWSPTPDQIDYVVGQLLGGTGRELMKAQQAVSSVFTGDELPVHKIPLLGRVYGETQGAASESQAYYDNLIRLNEHQAEVKYLREHGKGSEVSSYIADHPEARLTVLADVVERNVKKLRSQRSLLKDREAGSVQIRLVNDRITAQMQRLNERVVGAMQ